MKKYRVEEVIKKQEVLEGITCDSCKADIAATDIDFYYEVDTSRSLWGHNSIDSYEEFDLCCWECLTVHQGKYFAHADGTYSYRIEQVDKKDLK